MSNAGQFSLSRSCTRLAVDGKHMSGVNVPTTSRSMSRRVAIRGLQAADRRLGAEVARRLVGQREPALVDARPIDDPLGVEPVRRLQVEVADHVLGDVAPRPEDLDARQRAGPCLDVVLAVTAHKGKPRRSATADHASEPIMPPPPSAPRMPPADDGSTRLSRPVRCSAQGGGTRGKQPCHGAHQQHR